MDSCFIKVYSGHFDYGEIDHTDSGEPPHIRSENRLVVVPGRGSGGAKRFLHNEVALQSFSLIMYAECLYSRSVTGMSSCVCY